MRLISRIDNRANNLGNIEDRLERIERSLSGLSDNVQQIKTSQSSPASSSETSVGSRASRRSNSMFTNESGNNENWGPARGHVLRDVNGNERYFCSASLASLLLEATLIKERMTVSEGDNSFGSSSPPSKSPLDYVTELSLQDRIDLSNDGLSLALPPKIILDAMVDLYFTGIHELLPIFNKRNFEANLDAIYSGRTTGSDRAWTLCFNNIVLLSLTPKTLQSMNRQTHMDTGLLKSFIDNSRRGFQGLEDFLQPILCNVQVLITMVCFEKRPMSSLKYSINSLNCRFLLPKRTFSPA
jgi:hypothetical protein